MELRKHFQDLTSGVLALCAIAVVALMVRREMSPPTTSADGGATTPVAKWDSLIETGHRMGGVKPVLTVLEFADFECPACRAFENGTLGPFLREHRTEVAVVFRHWPLDYHKFAVPAARAGECAAKQGHFEEFYRLAYAKQDSLGLKSFESFAAESGVTDTLTFKACRDSREVEAAIQRDASAALEVGGSGTPSIIVNGWLFKHPPSRAQLDSALAAAESKSGQSS